MEVSFEEELHLLKDLEEEARSQITDLEQLPEKAEDLLLISARTELLEATERAIGNRREFNEPLSNQRLIEFFASEWLVTMNEDGGKYPTFHINLPSADEAKSAWDTARLLALEAMEVGTSPRHRNRSVEFKRAYWRDHVWGHQPTYENTIRHRLEALDGFGIEHMAAFWGFLETGTGQGAYPSTPSPTEFVMRTSAKIGSPSFSQRIINKLIGEIEPEIGKVIETIADGNGRPVHRVIEPLATKEGGKTIARLKDALGRYARES